MASLTTTSTSDKAEMKQSMRNEAEAMNNMEGKDEKGDIRVTTMAAAMECLNGMIPADGGEGGRYNYPAMHLGQGVCAGKDRQDVHRAFLLWCQKEEDRNGDSFNVSKAFRRLEAFADYQTRMFEKYFSTPIDIESEQFQKVVQIMDIKIPKDVHAETGAVVWVMDMQKWDMTSFKELESMGLSLTDVMRWFWSLMLTSMFDDVTCIHGVVIVEGMDGLGLSGMMSWQSAFKPIETDMNEMFYGITPFKMKACLIVGAPWWLSALLAFMRLFISKKISERLKNYSEESCQKYMGGVEYLPNGYFGGTLSYEERYPGMTGGNDDIKKEAEGDDEEEDIVF